jgi:uncharacterized membrane protein HdeD (DUF308 family)
MWVGIFLVCVGILVLLSNLGIIRGDVWEYIWPLLLILLGVFLLSKRSRRERHGAANDRLDHHDDRQSPRRP